jgi:trans-aconitate methyltransferase
MKGLPNPEIYEMELRYWPYEESLKRVIEIIARQAPKDGTLVDLMCGPGYLLGRLAQTRPDLTLSGVDIDPRYIDHSKKKYPGIAFLKKDIMVWEPDQEHDIVVCTGSLHHIPYGMQEEAMQRMAAMARPGGTVVISDAYIDDYSDEMQRQVEAAKLGMEYLLATIQKGAPEEVISSTLDILCNDVLMVEYKTSLEKRLPVMERIFHSVETMKTWPAFRSGYGDYISVCKKGMR